MNLTMIWFGISLIVTTWLTATCMEIPNEVINMECQDRALLIAVDLSFVGNEPRFEAVDSTGVYPITLQYAAECGYRLSFPPQQQHAELRASYFSCHVENKGDTMFTFSFNLNATHDDGQEVSYTLSKTCTPSLPWSPREVTCEHNYMEVSLKHDMGCPTGTKKEDWDAAFETAYTSANSDWQVMFQGAGQQLIPMAVSEARAQGYVFDMTDGRLVFRTPYGQPHSFTTTIDGVSVQVVHPTLFSRQNWVVLIVDLVTVCSMHPGSNEGDYLTWQTPELLSPLVTGLVSQKVSIGVNGQLFTPAFAQEKGYIMNATSPTFEIFIPYNAEGGYRQSLVLNNMYHEFFVFYLYFEQLFEDGNNVETRLRLLRPLVSPMLPRPSFFIDQTVLEERVFTMYLGDLPYDVEMFALTLNGQAFTLPFDNASSSLVIAKVPHPNNTHGYVLRVPFDDPAVIMHYSNGIVKYMLDVNYTLTIVPKMENYYHEESIEAVLENIFPPAFDSFCSETGISFKLDHQPFDYLWVVSIGDKPLSAELAAEQGYLMHNDSSSLQLDVPLFTPGYTYENIGLKTFTGSFELRIKNAKTLEVEAITNKTCQFKTTEIIVCSSDGVVTVVANLSQSMPDVNPSKTTMGRYCGPKRTDNSRVLYSLPLSSCGTVVKIHRDHVTYENSIMMSQKHLPMDQHHKGWLHAAPSELAVVQCTYPLSGLHRLFSAHRFESDFPGEGKIIHMAPPVDLPLLGLYPTMEPVTEEAPVQTTALQTTPAPTRPRPMQDVPAHHPSPYLVKVSRFPKAPTATLSDDAPKGFYWY